MMYSKTISLIISFWFVFCGVAIAQDESFLQQRRYETRIYMENPETSILAELFLRYGISIDNNYPKNYFSFKTTDSSDKLVVFIYYGDKFSQIYVGKYVYKKKNVVEEQREFVNAFVSWMVNNAWSKK